MCSWNLLHKVQTFHVYVPIMGHIPRCDLHGAHSSDIVSSDSPTGYGPLRRCVVCWARTRVIPVIKLRYVTMISVPGSDDQAIVAGDLSEVSQHFDPQYPVRCECIACYAHLVASVLNPSRSYATTLPWTIMTRADTCNVAITLLASCRRYLDWRPPDR